MLDEAKGVVITSFSKVGVKDDQQTRADLRKAGVYVKVVKKTLLQKVCDEQSWNFGLQEVQGNVAVAFSRDDEVTPAKLVREVAKKQEGFSIVGGLMQEGNTAIVLDAARVEELAQIPSREELLAKVVGSLASPLSGLVGVLSGTQRNFVYALKAIAEKKES